jgi:hypothetical protein
LILTEREEKRKTDEIIITVKAVIVMIFKI